MNILVVDDEPTLRRTLRITLERQGHAVADAADGAAAAARVRQARPDLVLLDLKLGRENGLDVLAEVLRVAPGLGVVVMTAHASVGTAVEAMRRGALDYLPKPFTPKQLAEVVTRWSRGLLKLLRLVQDRAYERVGEAEVRTADVRIVAATNRDLEADVAAGRFREDLLYRLNVIEVTVPPLRDRRADVQSLAEYLLAQFAGRLHRPVTGFTAAARDAIGRHRWPGNVREVRNAIELAMLLGKGPEIDAADLPAPVTVGADVPIDAVEVEHIRRVLAASPTLEVAARVLGIDPSTLYRKRKKYGL